MIYALAWSQDGTQVRLKGRVTGEDGSPVSFCMVRIVGQGAATAANVDGVYSISFTSADSVKVTFSMLGYKERVRILRKPKGQLTLNIVMQDKDTDLGEVEVKDVRRNMDQTVQIKTEEMGRMPSTSGNAVEELVATQAGVSQRNELSSNYTVRGGSFDENCVYINGVEVYRPLLLQSGQQEGLSVINSSMVEKVEFSAGGFAAKYADKMSSVLNISYRKPTKWEGNLSASLLGASGYFGWGNSKVSFSNSVRYKTNSYLLGAMETDADYSPNFIDYQAYLTWKPHKNWRVEAVGYISENNYKFVPHTRQTNFGTLQDVKNFDVYFDGWEQDLFRTFYGTIQVYGDLGKNHTIGFNYNAFNTRERVSYDIQGQYWLSNTSMQTDLAIGTYMEHARNVLSSSQHTFRLTHEYKAKGHKVESGIAYSVQNIYENAREWEYRDSSGYSMPHNPNGLDVIYLRRSPGKIAMKAGSFEIYSQDTWRREWKRAIMSLCYGVRLSYWSWNKEWLFSPRVSVGIVPTFNKQMTFRFATGLYYQRPFYKELRQDIHDGNSANSYVITLNHDIKSQRSYQFITGYDYSFRIGQRPFLFTTEAYIKLQGNLNPYTINNTKLVYYGRNCASGSVMGIDFKLFGEFVPRTDSWITFSLMRARMDIEGKSVPQPTDQTWSLNMFFSDYFPKTTRWKLNLKACFAGGLPFGAPHTGLEEHTFRSMPYKRVDIGMNYCPYRNEGGKRRNPVKSVWLGLDCLNVFGFENVSGYYWVTDVTDNQYAVPNYLTGRMFNFRVNVDF